MFPPVGSPAALMASMSGEGVALREASGLPLSLPVLESGLAEGLPFAKPQDYP